MTTRLSIDARSALLRAADTEAARRGDRYVGTEHLLLGLLAEPGGIAERTLGVTLGDARDALTRLDAQALEAVGVGPGLTTADPSGSGGHRFRLSNGAKQALVRAVTDAKDRGKGVISGRMLLAGVMAGEPPDPAADLVRFMGLDVGAIRLSLSKPGDEPD
jgi:ATP-dependent Clp protease ATP-binding subunit ClpA